MVGTITADGPGTVFYQFGAGKFDPGETIAFSAAGPRPVTHVMTFQPKYGNQMGGGAILEAIGADARAITAFPRKVPTTPISISPAPAEVESDQEEDRTGGDGRHQPRARADLEPLRALTRDVRRGFVAEWTVTIIVMLSCSPTSCRGM